MQTILICGATGFIGRNLVRHYANNSHYKVKAVYHQRPKYPIDNVEWVHGDLRNQDDVDRIIKDVDIIIQAAATTSGSKDITTKPFIHVTDNAVMNSILLRAAYENHIKHFVFFSCTVMYPSSDTPVREEDFTGELTDKYFGVGWTKVYIEKICEFYARLNRTKHTVIRHTNIYGPYDKFDKERSHVFGATITKVMQATNDVEIWGAGKEKRDLLHIDDLLSFIDCALAKQSANFGLYNCGLGESISIVDLVKKIIHHSGKNIGFYHNLDAPNINFNLTTNCDKAHQELGWQPKISLDEGIKTTVEWWKNNIDPNSDLLKDQ